jgi:hypothetical protein
MSIAKREPGARAPRKALATGVTIAALLLAGCGGGIGGGSDVGPLGGGNADGQGNFGSTMQTTTVAPTAAQPDDSSFSCPKVEVRGGAAAWQVTDKADNTLRYQATLGRMSRECRYTTPEMTMRIGIQGRVLMGAKGTAGLVNVPIRLAVVEEGPTPKPVWTRLYMVPVTIGAEVMQVDFSMVAEEPSFPRPDAATLERYVVYVGFDSQAAEVAEKKARPAKPKPVAAAPKPAAPAPTAARPAASNAAAQAAPAAARPAQSANSAPIYGTPQQQAPHQAKPAASIAPTNNQWIGTQPPETGGFMTPAQ